MTCPTEFLTYLQCFSSISWKLCKFVTVLMHRQLQWLDIQSQARTLPTRLQVPPRVDSPIPPRVYCVQVSTLTTRFTLRSARLQKTMGPRGFFHAWPTVKNSLTLNFPLAVLGTNWKLSFYPKLKILYFLNLVVQSSTLLCLLSFYLLI